MPELNLQGKDFFNEIEAAHYCCVSHTQFRAKAAAENILPRTWMGKKVYRKEDLKNAMERLWLP